MKTASSTRRRAPRVNIKAARKAVTNERRRKAKKNMDTFFFKAKFTGLLTPSQGATVSNYVSFNPSLLNGNGDWNLTNNTEFKLYQALYDKVRVNKIKVTYTPRANVFDQNNAQNDASLTLTGDGMIHTAIDRDGQIPQSIPRIMRYPSYKAYSVMKKFSRSYGVKWPRGMWLDCADTNWNSNGSWKFVDYIGAFGSIMLYGENFTEDKLEVFNEPIGNITLEYFCVFQGKTSASLSVDNSGNVIITPDTTTVHQSPATAQLQIGGITAKRYDLSGNLVPYLDTDLP